MRDVETIPGQTASTISQHFNNKRNVVKMLRQSLNEFKLVSTCHNTSQHCREGVSNGFNIGSQKMLRQMV